MAVMTLSASSASPRSWMQTLARLTVSATLAVSVAAIVLYSVDLYRHGKQKHYIGWFSGAGFVLLTIPISIRLIVQHLLNWNAPQIQKYVVRIAWMVPLYSVESWLALRFKNTAIYLETLREGYESYVIFCFLYYLIALLGDEQQLLQFKAKQAAHKGSDFGRHSWPVSLFCSPWSSGAELLQKCKFGVFQYVLIKNLFAALVFVLELSGHYSADRLRWDEIYLYQCMISNLSQLWALYCLVMFYYATMDELAPWRPVGKFLCVKSVVFFTWWQSIIIEALIFITNGRLLHQSGWTVNEVSKGIQNYLICVEMLFASIAFSVAFPHKEYSSKSLKRKDTEESKPFLSAFLQSSIPDDFFAQFGRLARGGNQTPVVTGKKRSSSMGDIEIDRLLHQPSIEQRS